MLKLTKKIKFSKKENKMKNFGNIDEAIKNFEKGKNKNLQYVLKERIVVIDEQGNVTPLDI